MEYGNRPMTSVGYLIVEAKTAEGALPVAGAVVNVSSTPGTGNVRLTVETDISGRTERLALPTVAEELSERPNIKHPYATYDISVIADGYYPFTAKQVPIFNGVTTLQPAMLIALSAYDSDSVYPRGNTSVGDTEPFQNTPEE